MDDAPPSIDRTRRDRAKTSRQATVQSNPSSKEERRGGMPDTNGKGSCSDVDVVKLYCSEQHHAASDEQTGG
jgi:hypothetical protein